MIRTEPVSGDTQLLICITPGPAIEVDELPAGDLPSGIGGHGDQGVAAGVIAYREVPDAMARVWTDGSP